MKFLSKHLKPNLFKKEFVHHAVGLGNIVPTMPCYIELVITDTPHGGVVYLAEMEVHSIVNGSDISNSAWAWASAEASPTQGADKAFDNTATAWYSGPSTKPWILRQSFPFDVNVAEITLQAGSGAYYFYAPQDFYLRKSYDLVAYSTLGSWSGQTFASSEIKTFII